MHARLQAQHRVALTGLGGIGKTQIALAYSQQHREDYAAVWWVTAATREDLIRDFVTLANELELPGRTLREQEQVVAVVQRWLERQPGLLLILDNADDLTLVKAFVPAGYPGWLLITTRAQATGELMTCRVNILRPPEDALLLLRRAKPLETAWPEAAAADRAAAEALAQELGGLPLALDQAGAYIEEQRLGIKEYHKLYRQVGAQLRQARGELAGDHPSVTVTFTVAFEQLAHDSAAAVDLLRLCAFLHSVGIPEELFTTAVDLGAVLNDALAQPLGLIEARQAAGRLSLLERDPQTHTLALHPVVQAVLRDGMAADTQRQWAERAVRMVAANFPEAEFANWPQCERLLSQALTGAETIQVWEFAFEAAGWLLNKTALYLHERGRYAEAEPLYQRVLAIRERALGPEHPNVAVSLHNLAELHRDQGRYAEAEPLYQRALAIYKQALGFKHPDVAHSLNGLALLYRFQGRYAEAWPLFEDALVIFKQALGSEHAHVGIGFHNFAVQLRDQGHYAEAEPLFQRALTIRERALGPEHPDVAQSLNGLAGLYQAQERYAEAEPLFQRALAIRERALGPEHRDVATSLNGLALLYHAQGRYAEAEPLYQRALAIYEQALGPEHLDVAHSLNGLALLYRDQGHYAEAKPLYQRALGILEQALGPEHPHVATTLNDLAALYYAQARYAEAEPLNQRALAIREQALPKHPAVATSLTNLASLYHAQGRYAEAEPLYQRALAIYKQALGFQHLNEVQSLTSLAGLYRVQKRYAEPELLLQRALGIFEQALGPTHPHTSTMRDNLTALHKAMKDPGERG